ncbi:MAG: hypothetical protein J2P57_04180 [Acidimicrobiaceae bacterium]|nr:hypothetical protein [Acidimicrobiaceae bacterium]
MSPDSEPTRRVGQPPTQRPGIVAFHRELTTRGLLIDELRSRYGRHCNVVAWRVSSAEALAHLDDAADYFLMLQVRSG